MPSEKWDGMGVEKNTHRDKKTQPHLLCCPPLTMHSYALPCLALPLLFGASFLLPFFFALSSVHRSAAQSTPITTLQRAHSTRQHAHKNTTTLFIGTRDRVRVRLRVRVYRSVTLQVACAR